MTKQIPPLLCATLALVATANSHAETVAYFKFDEGSGQNTASTGGDPNVDPLLRGFSSTQGGDPAWVTGVQGTGFGYDGDNLFAAYQQSQSDSAELVQTGDFTVELFFRPDALPANNNSFTLVSLYDEPGVASRNYEMRIRTTGGGLTFLEGAYDNTTGLVGGVPFGSAALSVGETYYASLIYDATANTLTTRVLNFNDDSFDYTDIETGVATITGSFTDPAFSIGARTNGGTNYEQNFNGMIDEVRISDSIVVVNDQLFSTIPEPSSFALIGGLLALGSVMFHRRN